MAIAKHEQLVPSAPIVTKRSYAAPLSFVGGTRRIVAWIKRVGAQGVPQAVGAWILGIAAMTGLWTFLIGWYFVVFGIFGLLTIPYRLIRRGSRKQVHLQEQQLATMQAMMIQQNQALSNNQPT